MSARNAQLDAVQGADEERKGTVQESTESAHRSQQRTGSPESQLSGVKRSNVSKSTGSADGFASGQDAAVRGSLSQYEIAVLYHPDLEVDLSKAEEKVTKLITGNGGKVVATDNWGKRKLAYPVSGQDYAVYVFYTIELPPANLAKLEATLNITDEVIRYLISKPDLKAIAKAEKLREEKTEKAAERGESADEKSAEDGEDEE
ncbi:30S ribosomal protein S6 [Candidatus Saccharibacteria bacterium]|nr:30S ribosomal protein S6 [Candidatus Saccharibacteria bacterium]